MSKLECKACKLTLPSSMKFCPRCHGALGVASVAPVVAPSSPTRQIPVLKPKVLSALVGVTLLAGALLVKGGEGVASFAARNTSVQTEHALGQVAMAEVADKLLSTSHPDSMLVSDIGKRLVASMPQPSRYASLYEFRVLVADEVNAFAVPGGGVVINTALLDLTNRRPELLAAVVAHEIQHVEQQHGLKGAYQGASLGLLTLWTFGLASDLGGALTSTVIGNRYTRILETEADYQGLELLVQAGYPASAMADMLRLLASAQQGIKVPAWLSTHPDAQDRARASEKQAVKLGK